MVTLHRDDGGLGFSVAGGKGTMPYRVDDEVCCLLFSCDHQDIISGHHAVITYKALRCAQVNSASYPSWEGK